MTDPATSPQGATEEKPVDQRGKAARSVKRDYEAGNGNHLPPVFGGTAPLITVQPAVWVNVIASRYRTPVPTASREGEREEFENKKRRIRHGSENGKPKHEPCQ
jgi:hypothetical protein